MFKNMRVENGELIYEEGFDKRKKSDLKNVSIEYKYKIEEINDIEFIYNGKKLDFESKIYENNQRYYISLEEGLNKLNIKFKKIEDNYLFNDVSLDLKNNAFTLNDHAYSILGKALHIDNKTYISLNDFENMLGLRDHWNHGEKKIYIFENKDSIKARDREQMSGKPALIRLEDVSAGNKYITSDGIEKTKLMADLLYQRGAKFNVAWISRFKDPSKKIDNDLLENRSMANVQFINMLDYLIFRGGTVGLHGYTHQAGIYASAVGSDLSKEFNSSEEETRNIVESAIKTSKILNIPASFFESGHYHATRKQQAIIEEYFDICYEPYKYYWNFRPMISKRNDFTVYVPTPLSYVKDENGEEVVNKINKNKNNNVLTSLFLHPTKEMNFIKISDIDENGVTHFEYDKNSPLNNILNELERTGYVTVSVNSFR